MILQLYLYIYQLYFLVQAKTNEEINKEYWSFVQSEIIKEFDFDYDLDLDDFYDFVDVKREWDEYDCLEYWADF